MKVTAQKSSTRRDMPRDSSAKLYGSLSAITVFVLISLGGLHQRGENLISQYTHLISGITESRLEIVDSHLGLEKALSGEGRIDDVLLHLDRAQGYLKAALEGGDVPQGRISAVENQEFRERIRLAMDRLQDFRSLTLQRWERGSWATEDSQVDRDYDALSQELTSQAGEIEMGLHEYVHDNLQGFRMLRYSLMALCMVVVLITARTLAVALRQQRVNQQRLWEANQQLCTSNQQLQASGQQLQAGEQQLRATNQHLIASEERFRSLIEAAPFGAHEYELNEHDELIFEGFNPAANRITGRDNLEYMGKPHEEVVPFLAQSKLPEAFRRIALSGGRYDDEHVDYLEGQVHSAFEISAFQIRPRRMAVFFRDITERIRAQEALKKERNLIMQLMETSPVGVMVVDCDKTIQFANARALEILGCSLDYLTEHFYEDPVWHVTDYDGRPIVPEQWPFEQIQTTGASVYDIQHAIETPDHRKVYLSVNAAPLWEEGRSVHGMVLTIEDVTERIEAEGKIAEYRDHLRALVSQLTLSEEKERKRLAEEVHDNLGQLIAIMKMKVDSQLAANSHVQISDFLFDMQSMLTDVLGLTQQITKDLGCPLLQQLGFRSAVEEWLHSEIEKKFSLETRVQDNGFAQVDEEAAAMLFRAIRELSMNIVKHAQARKIIVTLSQNEGLAEIEVSDDGVGFDPDTLDDTSASGGGYGLFSIKERIDYMNGLFEIHSHAGQGTTVKISVPTQVAIE